MDVEQTSNQDQAIMDIDEFDARDTKINPDLYIHFAIMKAQQALIHEDTSKGFLQFRVIVEHLESVCRAAKYLPDDYDIEVSKVTGEVVEEKDYSVKHARIANKKMEVIMKAVFDRAPQAFPLKG